jgi:hypothetical protein
LLGVKFFGERLAADGIEAQRGEGRAAVGMSATLADKALGLALGARMSALEGRRTHRAWRNKIGRKAKAKRKPMA